MNVYVLDVCRLDKTRPPRNVREERYVVFATVDDEGTPTVCEVIDRDAHESFLEDWLPAERFDLYEKIRAADRNWRALTETLGREDSAPGRVA